RVTFGRAWPPPPHARLSTLRPGFGSPLLHADCTAVPRQPLLSARGRCRSARSGGPPPAHGKRGRPPNVGSPRPQGHPPARRGLCRRPRAGNPPPLPPPARPPRGDPPPPPSPPPP